MKRSLGLVAAIAVLTACATSRVETPGPGPADPVIGTDQTAALEAPGDPVEDYDEAWYISSGWPGEYPLGFSVLEDGVVLMGRARMHPSALPDVACPVAKYATYHQWNNDRVMADELAFVTATQTQTVTMSADAPIEVPADTMGYETKRLDLKAGDQLIYKRYLGEGYAIIEVNGRAFDINEAELANVSDIETVLAGAVEGEHLWVEIACLDEAGSRAWVLFGEAVRTDGVGPSPVFGYGESRDLDPAEAAISQDLKQALAEMDERQADAISK